MNPTTIGMTTSTYPLTIGGEEDVLSERHLLTQVEAGLFMASAESVRFLIIHCSATRSDRDYTEEQLLRDHKTRGFRTVGYHFYIRKSGLVSQYRKLLEVGAHCRPYNRCSIGICYEGGLDTRGNVSDTRTQAQKEQLLLLLMKLKKLFPQALIRGHNEMPGATPKACPCFSVREYQYLDEVRLPGV